MATIVGVEANESNDSCELMEEGGVGREGSNISAGSKSTRVVTALMTYNVRLSNIAWRITTRHTP